MRKAPRVCLTDNTQLKVKKEIVRKNILNCAALLLSPVAQLVLTVDRQASVGSLLQLVPDNAQVLASCEPAWDIRAASECDCQAFHLGRKVISETAPAGPGAFVKGVLERSRVPVTLKPPVDPSDSTPRLGGQRIRTKSAQASMPPPWPQASEAEPIIKTSFSPASGYGHLSKLCALTPSIVCNA